MITVTLYKLEIAKYKSSSYVLFQDCVGYFGHFHANFRINLSISAKNPSGMLIVMVLTLSQLEGEQAIYLIVLLHAIGNKLTVNNRLAD